MWIVWTEVVVSVQTVLEVIVGADGPDVSFGIFDSGEGLGVMDVHGLFDLVDGRPNGSCSLISLGSLKVGTKLTLEFVGQRHLCSVGVLRY